MCELCGEFFYLKRYTHPGQFSYCPKCQRYVHRKYNEGYSLDAAMALCFNKRGERLRNAFIKAYAISTLYNGDE